MMRTFFLAALLSAAICGTSQNMQVQNMVNYLRNKDYVKAKAAADAAVLHESTSGKAKTWKYRGDVYKAIFDTSARDMIDKEAEEKALEAYVRCMELDKEEKVYKDDVYGNLVKTAGATRDKAAFYVHTKQYDKALKCYEVLEKSIPFDFTGGIKRQNVTADKLMYQRFEVYRLSGDKAKTVELATKLIDMGYKERKIYTDMVNLSMLEKDTAAALKYIEKGRVLFDEDEELITREIDIYLAQKRIDVLEKKVQAAVDINPYSVPLYLVLANIQKRSGKSAEAEKTFIKALELDPDHELANYNFGMYYYDLGKDLNEKQGKLKYGDKKFNEYENGIRDNFKKAITYFEKYYDSKPDPQLKQVLSRLSARIEDSERFEKYKK